MKKNLIKWFIVLLGCFIISTFLHELGHGVSSYAVGQYVSTGFNRVGDVYKKPHDLDFRKDSSKYENPYDMGPNVTLILAIVFTFGLAKIKSKNQTTNIVVGALALSNSLIRLIPMIHSYFGFVIRGKLYEEDEVGTGLLWYKLSGVQIMKYLPSIISIVISLVCLYYVIKMLKNKLPELARERFYFSSIIVVCYILSFIIENFLDNIIRINWI